jgi:hypothetical protein
MVAIVPAIEQRGKRDDGLNALRPGGTRGSDA